MAQSVTTVKISKDLKDKIDSYRVYKRETYEEILQFILSSIDMIKISPERARMSVISREKHKRNMGKISKVEDSN